MSSNLGQAPLLLCSDSDMRLDRLVLANALTCMMCLALLSVAASLSMAADGKRRQGLHTCSEESVKRKLT